ncbi:hypothetical protein [Streptomyces sp. NPDC059575]|uniref:hypothetical protein n=1 Tax=Streptomyces sp. NPDC059575 TaxID=3346872 RepID=UPI00368EB8E0
MVETVRYFTVAEPAALCVPPGDPNRIEFYEHILADELVAVRSRTARRRCPFRAPDDGRTYAVEYEAPLDTGDFEVGDDGPGNHGRHGDTMEAVEVQAHQFTVTCLAFWE